MPTTLQDWRDRRRIAAAVDDRPANWEFTEPPADRLDAYIAHLRQLGDAIVLRGSQVVISTHATLTGPVTSRDELAAWDGGRVHIPRAPSEVAARFHFLANERIRQLSAQTRWALVDADARLSGRSELFGDLVHFNDEGAAKMAQLIATTILTARAPGSDKRAFVPPVHLACLGAGVGACSSTASSSSLLPADHVPRLLASGVPRRATSGWPSPATSSTATGTRFCC